MISVEDCVRMEEAGLRNHLRKSIEPLMIAAMGILIGEEKCMRQDCQGFHEFECFKEESGKEFKERILEEREGREFVRKSCMEGILEM